MQEPCKEASVMKQSNGNSPLIRENGQSEKQDCGSSEEGQTSRALTSFLWASDRLGLCMYKLFPLMKITRLDMIWTGL